MNIHRIELQGAEVVFLHIQVSCELTETNKKNIMTNFSNLFFEGPTNFPSSHLY